MLLRQSTARNLMVLMVNSTDHITGVAGATLTINLSKDGGAFASISPTVTDRGNGWYSIALTAAHTDTLGDLALRITAASCDPTDLTRQVVALLPGENVTVGAFAAGAITTAAFTAGAVDATVAPNLDAAVTSRLATAGYTAPANADIATILTRTDVATSTRLASAGYTAPDNAGIGTLTTRLTAGRATNLDNLDATVSSRLATAGYTVPPTDAVIVDRLLGRSLAGGADGGRTVRDALRALRNRQEIAAGTLTTYQENDSSVAWTAAVTSAPGNPLVSVDPD